MSLLYNYSDFVSIQPTNFDLWSDDVTPDNNEEHFAVVTDRKNVV